MYNFLTSNFILDSLICGKHTGITTFQNLVFFFLYLYMFSYFSSNKQSELHAKYIHNVSIPSQQKPTKKSPPSLHNAFWICIYTRRSSGERGDGSLRLEKRGKRDLDNCFSISLTLARWDYCYFGESQKHNDIALTVLWEGFSLPP